MYDLHKISKIVEKYTHKKDLVYSIQLDHNIWINNVNPDLTWKSSGKKNMSMLKTLNKSWLSHDKSLKFLEGKYVDILIVDSEYGKKINRIGSIDIIGDFQVLLQKNKGKSFQGTMSVYKLLKSKNYEINQDASITLKVETKNGFELRILQYESNYFICYRYGSSFDLVTMENLEILYDKFYKDVKYKSGDNNGDGVYYYQFDGICVLQVISYYRINRKDHKPDDSSTGYTPILMLGQALTDEQRNYFATFKDKELSNVEDLRSLTIEEEKHKEIKALVYEDGLFGELQKRRSEVAREKGVPAYLIFGDKTLRHLASEKPLNKESMLEVNGIGEKKVGQYGEEFLKLINEYVNNESIS